MSYESTTEHIICTLSISSKIFSDTYLKHVNPNKNSAPIKSANKLHSNTKRECIKQPVVILDTAHWKLEVLDKLASSFQTPGQTPR